MSAKRQSEEVGENKEKNKRLIKGMLKTLDKDTLASTLAELEPRYELNLNPDLVPQDKIVELMKYAYQLRSMGVVKLESLKLVNYQINNEVGNYIHYILTENKDLRELAFHGCKLDSRAISGISRGLKTAERIWPIKLSTDSAELEEAARFWAAVGGINPWVTIEKRPSPSTSPSSSSSLYASSSSSALYHSLSTSLSSETIPTSTNTKVEEVEKEISVEVKKR